MLDDSFFFYKITIMYSAQCESTFSNDALLDVQ
jgi:hypothetical protein